MRIKMGDFCNMRLYNIYYICKQCEEMINNLVITRRNTNPVTYCIEGWNDYKEVLFTIRQVALFRELVNDFYETVPVFVREKERPEIDSETQSRLDNKKNAILMKMRTIISLYESMELEEGENGIDVKIPKCNSLGLYISYLKELDFILNQCPFLQHKDGKIEFNTVDVGSQWITFLVIATTGTAAISYILNNLAVFIDKAVHVKSHINNLEQQKEIVRSMKLQNDVLESNMEVYENLKKHYISEAVKEIEEENPENKLKDGEEVGKAEKALEKLMVLLDKGVEIYASIDTRKEIQMLFPALEDKAELPDGIMKFLEEKE